MSEKMLLDKIVAKARSISQLRDTIQRSYEIREKLTIDLERYRGELATEEADLSRLIVDGNK